MSDEIAAPPKQPKKLKPKQKRAIELWLSPQSKTYGNLYKSCVEAGFRNSYALNIASNKPLWLSETVESTLKLEREHIINGIQHLATNPYVDSRSPADTNLKAYELLAKYAGLDQSTGTTINIVQPILNGQSMSSTPVKVDVDIAHQPE